MRADYAAVIERLVREGWVWSIPGWRGIGLGGRGGGGLEACAMSCPEGFADLFGAVVEADRARLAGSVLGGLRPDEGTADVFCGAGGWDEGAKRCGVRVDAAVNHWDRAIEVHARNNPGCSHHLGDAWRAKPRQVMRAAGVKKLGLLLASAACTSHSRAKGSAPVSKRVHMLGWCIARWMEEGKPRVVWIENVPEWIDWGPLIPKLDEQGRPVKDEQGRAVMVQDPKRKGQHFNRWWRYCERLGYRMEMRVLDAPDFGAASRRKRLYVQARRDGMPLVWPEATHGGKRQKPHRAAAEIIDWSDLGTSIFERPRPLKPKTLARIAEGIRRFVLNDSQPFVLRVSQAGDGWRVWPTDEPMPTQTTRQDLAVCTPILAPQNGGVFGQRVDEPGPTITTKGHQALIAPLLAVTGYGERDGQRPRCQPIREPLNTIVAQKVKQAVISPVLMHNTSGHPGGPVTGPIPTVTTGGQTGLVSPVMVTLRNHVAPARPDAEPLNGLCAGGTHHALVAALLCTYYGNSTTLRPASEPLGCVTTLDRHALVSVVIHGQEYVIVDILFRMLRPHELALAMGFPTEYQWPASQRDATRLIGNAVHVDVAAALIGASLPRGRMGMGDRRAVA